MKKLSLAALVLLLALPAAAQQNVLGYFYLRHDTDATALTYCRSEGQQGSVFNAPVSVAAPADSSGTAVTATTATTVPFTGLGVGDVVFLTDAGITYPRGILTFTDADTLVTDEALTASAAAVSWRNNVCGTTASSGWVSTAGLANLSVGIFLTQFVGDGDGMDVRIEGTVRTPDGTTNLVQVWPEKAVGAAASVQNFAAAGAGVASNLFVNITAPMEALRVAVFHSTADEGNDLTTNAEQITVVLYGTRVVG